MVLIKPATRNEASSPLRPYNEIINGNKQITKNAYVNEDGTNSFFKKRSKIYCLCKAYRGQTRNNNKSDHSICSHKIIFYVCEIYLRKQK